MKVLIHNKIEGRILWARLHWELATIDNLDDVSTMKVVKADNNYNIYPSYFQERIEPLSLDKYLNERWTYTIIDDLTFTVLMLKENNNLTIEEFEVIKNGICINI